MHFWGAIVDGGCYQPGCLDSFITTRRVPRLLLTREGFERRLGPPVEWRRTGWPTRSASSCASTECRDL